MSKRSRTISVCVAACMSLTGMLQSAQATLVSTEQVASQAAPADAGARSRVLAALDRADVAAALAERGVSADQARERVNALSDSEAAYVAAQIDSAPAGANTLVGAIVFIFVVLLITDILGFTKVFPFTSSMRR